MRFIKGVFICILINQILKNIFRQQRPNTEKHCIDKYGMPSGHSQLAFFCFFYFANKNNFLETLIMLLLSIYISYTRVILQCHTVNQVLVGSVIGSFLGIYYK